MVEVGVRRVKDHLSEYLRKVRAGERVLITDRGKPVAMLVGIGQVDSEEAAWSLVDRGLGEWSGGKPCGATEPPRVAGRRAEEVVSEDRR